jgi:hypothetical protein
VSGVVSAEVLAEADVLISVSASVRASARASARASERCFIKCFRDVLIREVDLFKIVRVKLGSLLIVFDKPGFSLLDYEFSVTYSIIVLPLNDFSEAIEVHPQNVRTIELAFPLH